MSDELNDLKEELQDLIESLDKREPTDEEEELIEELQSQIMEIEDDVVSVDDLSERKDRLMDVDEFGNPRNPALLDDGEIDSWERWREDSGSP